MKCIFNLLTSLFLCLFFLQINEIQAQSNLRVSILTCGVGEELYSSYGHSAIRVVDSASNQDVVYNYGTFNFGDPDFYSKFTRGKLLYYVNDEQFNNFMSQYVEEGRSVYEQTLQLSQADALAINSFLINNLKEENKYYKYDFLFDNCSTRIRDLFINIFKDRIHFNQIISNDSVSFRTFLNYYERNVHWERFGINLLMSNLVDQKMTSFQSMFLPDYLMKGFDIATLDGKKIVEKNVLILPATSFVVEKMNQPLIVFWLLFVSIVLLSFLPKMNTALKYFDIFFFMILGLLGFFMLFMWFGTEHKVCAWNRNILWAFPLHLFFAFMIPRADTNKLSQYAKYATWLIVGSMFYSIVAQQKYIQEITPLIFLILFRLNKYRMSKLKFLTNFRR